MTVKNTILTALLAWLAYRVLRAVAVLAVLLGAYGVARGQAIDVDALRRRATCEMAGLLGGTRERPADRSDAVNAFAAVRRRARCTAVRTPGRTRGEGERR
jgi:hypothetical protein